MKNVFKLAGIIVMAAVIGFSFVSCSNGSTDGPAYIPPIPTYTAAIFSVSATHYNEVFGNGKAEALTNTVLILPGTKDDLIFKVTETKKKDSCGIVAANTGLSYATVEGTVRQNKTTMEIEEGEITTLMDTLKSKGYVVGVIKLTGGDIGVAAAYQE